MPSRTSGCGGRPASAAFSVRIRWQKLWKLLTVMRARDGGPTASLDPLAQFRGGLDVVGQDQELLREEVLCVLEEPPDPLDDDPGLARPGTRDDHDRAIAPLDDSPLLVGQGDGGGRCSQGRGCQPRTAPLRPRSGRSRIGCGPELASARRRPGSVRCGKATAIDLPIRAGIEGRERPADACRVTMGIGWETKDAVSAWTRMVSDVRDA